MSACADYGVQVVQLAALLVALELRAQLAKRGVAPRRLEDRSK